MSGSLYFEPSARLQRFLGRELISDPNLAIIEFVKNSYDAGARRVQIVLRLAGRSKEEQEIVVADDGSGMDLDSFKKNWMRPGYSSKALNASTLVGGVERLVAGEKGLGRLAGGRLGERLEVFTRMTEVAKWLHVVFDWNDFSNMDVAMRRVPVSYESANSADSVAYSTGTVVVIRDLTLDWRHRVPGRKMPGRSDIRVGRLLEDLRLLQTPLAAIGGPFEITLTVDDPALADLSGAVQSKTSAPYDYGLSFSVRPGKNSVHVSYLIERGETIVGRLRLEASESNEFEIDLGDLKGLEADQPEEEDPDEEGRAEGEPELNKEEDMLVKCGEFTGSMFYYPTTSAARLKEIGIQPGVSLYRDGIRVEPYGNADDDWLGIRARKASRQGHAGIQPNLLSGSILISRKSNPNLIDMSNRQGLIENEASEEFVAICEYVFRRFESHVYEEYVKTGWTTATERTQTAAEQRQQFTVAVIRAIMHSVRQPLAALGSEIGLLKKQIEDASLDDDDRERIELTLGHCTSYLRNLDGALIPYLAYDQDALLEGVQTFELFELLEDAASRTASLLASSGIDLQIIQSDNRDDMITFNRLAVLEATVELIRNAVSSLTASGKAGGVVMLSVTSDAKDRMVVVSDNGPGIPNEVRERFSEVSVSLTGATGSGIRRLSELLALFGGKFRLLATGPRGTSMGIVMPKQGTLRKGS